MRFIAWPFQWLGYKGDPTQPPAVRALTALGPAYIKFGQILSTRADVVGTELAGQLRMLQDRLPPFPTDQARQIVAAELRQPVDLLFSEFSEPVAAVGRGVDARRPVRGGIVAAVRPVDDPGIAMGVR